MVISKEINSIFNKLINNFVKAIYAYLRDAEAAYPRLIYRIALPKRYIVLTSGLSRNAYIRNAIKDRVRVLNGRLIKLILLDGD